MRVVFAVNAELGTPAAQMRQLASARYRGFIPAEQLNAEGIAAEVISLQALLVHAADWAMDVLVLHQPKYDMLAGTGTEALPVLLAGIDALRRRGGRLAIDVSDFKLNAEHDRRLAQQAGAAAVPAYRAALAALFARADAFTLPTEGLARLQRASLPAPLPPLFVIPDMVEVARQPPRLPALPVPPAPLQLLWFGMLGAHRSALAKFVREDLPRLAAARPCALTLVCEPLTAAESAAVLPGGPERHGARLLPWSLPVLEQALRDCDIVVLPFDYGSQLSLGRSNNRALQALYAGRPVAAHPIESYRSLAPYIEIGVALPAAVAAILADPARSAEKLRQGQQHVEAEYSPAALGQRWRAALLALRPGLAEPGMAAAAKTP